MPEQDAEDMGVESDDEMIDEKVYSSIDEELLDLMPNGENDDDEMEGLQDDQDEVFEDKTNDVQMDIEESEQEDEDMGDIFEDERDDTEMGYDEVSDEEDDDSAEKLGLGMQEAGEVESTQGLNNDGHSSPSRQMYEDLFSKPDVESAVETPGERQPLVFDSGRSGQTRRTSSGTMLIPTTRTRV